MDIIKERQTWHEVVTVLREENEWLRKQLKEKDRLLAAYADKDEKILGAFREMGVL